MIKIQESEELARKYFYSLIKDDSGPFRTVEYIILNDGDFVTKVNATNDKDAIKKFNYFTKEKASTPLYSVKEDSMRKVTQSFLKSLVRDGIAEDVTDADWEDIKDKVYDKIYYSTSELGLNGCGFTDKDGNMYVITSRGANLFRVV